MKLFNTLWVVALLFIIALLIVVMGQWDWFVRIGAVIACAALAALFVLHNFSPERHKPRYDAEPLKEEEAAFLEAVNVMVVSRLKEIETVIGAKDDEGLTALNETEARIRQAREFSISSAIASAPTIVLSEEELLSLALNRAWKISQLQFGTALRWTHESGRTAEVAAVSGYERSGEKVPPMAVPPELAQILRQGKLEDCAQHHSAPAFQAAARTRFAIPVGIGARYWGFLVLEHPEERKLTDLQTRFLHALGREAAAALEAMKLWYDARRSLSEVLARLGDSLDERRNTKSGRGRRLASLFNLACLHTEMDENEREAGILAAYLIDLGEIGVPELVLNKDTALAPQERKFFEGHPALSVKLLRQFLLLHPTEEIVIAHHERWNGSGYPLRIAGEDIPRPARLLAVCDTLEAMMSDRPHRGAMDVSDALIALKKDAGQLYDPEMVEAVAVATAQWQAQIQLAGKRSA